ncbi:MAG: NUDIX domain-containing protein [Anaerolineales bacterium]
MSQVLYGPRLGKEGELRLGCSAILFDAKREKVLLTRRTDNGRWCLPGGRVEPGESVQEACEREVWEETGLKISITRLVGVYSNPDQLVIYNDGNKVFMVVLSFEAKVIDGQLTLSDETSAFGYFSLAEMDALPMHGQHKFRVEDALRGGETLIK